MGIITWASLVAQTVKKKKSVCSAGALGSTTGWEDPLEKGMATHSSILAWRIPWAEESGRLQSMGSQRVRHDSATNTFTFITNTENVWATLLHLCPHLLQSFSSKLYVKYYIVSVIIWTCYLSNGLFVASKKIDQNIAKDLLYILFCIWNKEKVFLVHAQPKDWLNPGSFILSHRTVTEYSFPWLHSQ